MWTAATRLLGDLDLVQVDRVLAEDPIGSAQVAERVDIAGLSWYRQEGRVFGYGARHRLESLCWVGVNVVPIRASDAALDGFAEVLGNEARVCSSIVGPAEGVLGLWGRLRWRWGPDREVRACQPLLAMDGPPLAAADPLVRRVRPDEIDLLYPAAVAMYLEEVGVSPLAGGGGQGYRDRVGELVRAGRTYARFLDGTVVFKADLGIVTRRTAQIQGVWTDPAWRGRGIATAGVAAVVADALRRVAPTVSLYVNDYNHPARAVYHRCGFRQVGTFATVLF
jgi:predicted GNAT family acetyltransferase